MYAIRLNDDEMSTLGWAANRGYFPSEAYDGLSLREGERDEVPSDVERVWELSEPAAWSILDMANNEPSDLYTCIGGELLEKLVELEMSIV